MGDKVIRLSFSTDNVQVHDPRLRSAFGVLLGQRLEGLRLDVELTEFEARYMRDTLAEQLEEIQSETDGASGV